MVLPAAVLEQVPCVPRPCLGRLLLWAPLAHPPNACPNAALRCAPEQGLDLVHTSTWGLAPSIYLQRRNVFHPNELWGSGAMARGPAKH